MAPTAPRQHVLEELERIGLSTYEGRAYLSLLEAQPVNGYDLARASGIPASKIYETLQRLVAKGAAIASANEPTLYRATPPEELIASYRRETEQSLEFLGRALPQLSAEPSPGVVWRLRGNRTVLRHLLEVVNGASREIFLSIWPAEAVVLADSVDAARRRGVRVWVASFGQSSIEGEGVYDLLSCGESSSARLGRRLTAAVADDRHAIVVEFADDAEAIGTLADDPSLGLATKEYIVHDLINHALIEEIGPGRFEQMRIHHPMLSRLLGAAPQSSA